VPITGLQRALPAGWYLDHAHHRRERERIFFREWVCAGRADQVAPGSLVVLHLAGESVLLLRTGDSQVGHDVEAPGREAGGGDHPHGLGR
jgi:phenylpropionate dioxygenase-like ring-hydroxylating dioxygenase large terminal subunit